MVATSRAGPDAEPKITRGLVAERVMIGPFLQETLRPAAGSRSEAFIITSQVPIEQWYEIIGNPTIADAILDRLVHNAYRIELTGESLGKKQNPATANSQP